MNRGWLTLGRLRGAPVRVHFTLLVGALFWSGFRFAPAFWLGFALLIFVHELGHALFVLHFDLGLTEIALHGAGGHCAHRRTGTQFQEAAVAWGGVLAQLTLWLATQAWLLALGPPRSAAAASLVAVFGRTNLWLAAFNLIPVEPFDGARAWRLAGMLVARLRTGNTGLRNPFRSRTVQDELRDIERLRTREETPSERTDRIVAELIARTTRDKDR
jgi:Zn-dependent protease